MNALYHAATFLPPPRIRYKKPQANARALTICAIPYRIKVVFPASPLTAKPSGVFPVNTIMALAALTAKSNTKNAR